MTPRPGNTHNSTCLIWPTHTHFCLFGPANTLIAVCSVWPMPKLRSAWSGHYPQFDLANGLALDLFGQLKSLDKVCSVWPRVAKSVRSGQYLFLGMVVLKPHCPRTKSAWSIPVLGRGPHPWKPTKSAVHYSKLLEKHNCSSLSSAIRREYGMAIATQLPNQESVGGKF